MHHRALLSVLTACLAVTLSACGSSGGAPDATSPVTGVPTSSPSPTSPLPTSPTAPASTGGAAPSPPVAVNRTLTDPVFGNRATVLKYVVGYQPSHAATLKYAALADEQVVLVQVEITAGTKYYGTFGGGDFRLTGDPSGIDTTTNSTLDGELTKAGYPPVQDVQPGRSTTGWLVFLPQKTLTTYTLRLVRLAYSVAGKGTKIPAKNFDLTLNP